MLLLLCCLSLALTACQEKRIYKIGVSQCSSDDWRNKCNEEIHREMIFHPDAQVEIRSAEDSNEKQIADIRYFVDNGFDIIVVAPNEADAITPIIKEVYERGIPVVIFDRNINGESYTAYQGVDNQGIGESAARYARHLVGEGGKVIEIYGRPGSTPAIERHAGFVRETERGGLNMLATPHTEIGTTRMQPASATPCFASTRMWTSSLPTTTAWPSLPPSGRAIMACRCR